MYSIGKIAGIVQGKLVGSHAQEILYLSADSRKISFPLQTLFFAIKKERRDGHQFITDVYEQGVRCFVISSQIDTAPFTGAAFILVNNSMQALQHLAAFHRSQFKIPVIGITGSNGKTIIKEWLHQLLEEDFNIVRSPKSYNSQLGVPLSVWQIQANHQLAIFEAGISLPNEMEALEKIIQPTIGILTNIGTAHSEGFTDINQKLREKLLLFKAVDRLICSMDQPSIKAAIEEENIPVFTWGSSDASDIKVLSKRIVQQETLLELWYEGKPYSFRVAFTDDAYIENVMQCIALMVWLKIPTGTIQKRLLLLTPVEMRLEWKKAIHNSYILNDSYSNDLSSLIIALDYARQQKRGKSLTVVLTDFAQAHHSKKEMETLYHQAILLIKQHGVQRVIAIGSSLPGYAEVLKKELIDVRSYPNTAALIADLPNIVIADETILVKGARHFGLEKLVAFLEQQTHQTVLEINLTALAHNLQQYRQILNPGVKMMVMVKAFGYGSGDAEIARLLQFNKVDYLAVAYTDEGVALRKAGIHLPIMVMNPETESFASMEEHNLEPEIFSFDILEAFSAYCRQQGIRQYPVHLKVDTGMHRLGFIPGEIEKLAHTLSNQHVIVVKSVFTHLASSEMPEHDAFSLFQYNQYQTAANMLEDGLGYSFIRHIVNTAGMRRHRNMQLDMVRLGIGLYGVDNDMQLQVVTTLKTTVAQVKEVKGGDSIGYNLKGRPEKDTQIATIRIGYADGFRRALSNGRGKVWINGHLAPVIGNVSMDMTMVDISAQGTVQAGDAVEIFGENIPVQQVAKACDTIAYEILTSISQRVKRVYLQE